MQASNLVKMMFSSGPDIRANAKLDLMPKLEENSIIKDLIHNAGTICRPSINQEEYFSGHKRHHCVIVYCYISEERDALLNENDNWITSDSELI
jgi:hypothetical protein